VKSSSYVGPDYQKSNGLSVYFPWISVPESFSDGYEQLEFTRLTESKWHQFLIEFTEGIRAQLGSGEITVDESNISQAGKTLYSARTLWGGRSGSSGQGPGGPLYMAYSKAPSLVWTPRKTVPPKPLDRIDKHVRDLRYAPSSRAPMNQENKEKIEKALTEKLGVVEDKK
jgi:hypothetical protein